MGQKVGMIATDCEHIWDGREACNLLNASLALGVA